MSATPAQPSGAVKAYKTVEPFLLGGASGMFATAVIQPMDMIKVRIQVSGEGGGKANSNPFSVARQLVNEKGFLYLYTGLGAGLLRQATYTTARLGIFRSISAEMDKNAAAKGQKTSMLEKAVAGLVAGGLGSIVGTPADLALIRMQTDATLPVEQRRNYTGVVNALTRIVREEGFMGMFKGCLPVVTRAMALNVGMLSVHDEVLDSAKKFTSSKELQHVAAKSCAGFFACVFSLPFDLVKTRIQKQKPDATGALPYKGSLDCARKVLMQEGPLAFYRGFWTYYARIAPHVMITLFAYDAMKAFMDKQLQ